jgi:integrase
MQAKLTQKMVHTLRPEPGRDVVLWDAGDGSVKGFGLRVKPSGAAAFIIQYRNQHRHSKRLTLGSASVLKVEKAREMARHQLMRALDGGDPAAEKAARTDAATFKVLAERFIERYARVRNRDWVNTERIFLRHVNPAWGTRAISSIERRDVRELLQAVAESAGPIASNRTLAAVRKAFNWAASLDMVEVSPVVGVAPLSPERRRERLLHDGELKILWAAFGAVDVFGDFFKLLLLVGQRRSETAGILRASLSLAPRSSAGWVIPAEANKAGRAHYVPLSEQAVETIERAIARTDLVGARRARGSSSFVFSTNGRRPISSFSAAKLLADAEIARLNRERPEADRVPVEDWRLHDLRRAAATGMSRFGSDRFTVSRVLNHADPSVTGRYDLFDYADQKRRALEAWARGLARIIEPPAENIVEMKRSAG